MSAAFATAPLLGLLEHAFGRPLVCRCGRLALWADSTNGPENSQMVADWYSLGHIVHGLLFYAALALVSPRSSLSSRFLAATVLEAAWELVENSPQVIARYRAATIALGYSGDSILNSVSDLGAMMIGFGIAARMPATLSILFGLALEVASLVAIRDNLTLNVLMLAYPIDAVRRWQAGA